MADLKSLPFPTCVVVETPDKPGALRRIGCVREAAECLLHGWPAQKGMGHRLAIVACYNALRRDGPVHKAHSAFITAAMEDGIFVREAPLNSRQDP
jgi:hypothetical protein